ncbi:MAG TPA: paraquat-inducible protein A [Burkholderiales bacterium]|nr:paraquat-inducible protein A [Burkholderiales bacterium]
MMAPATVVSCNTCGLVQAMDRLPPGAAAECTRCGSFITASSSRGRLEVVAALSLAALVLYVPANIYPILKMHLHGSYSESTVWDGVVTLMTHNEWAVAVIVFLASMVIPLVKLAGLFALVLTARMGWSRHLRERTWLYKFIDAIGPWAMLDVFLLAVLVALVKLSSWAQVIPGPGLLAFTAMVVLTMLASAAFDPKLIWERR